MIEEKRHRTYIKEFTGTLNVALPNFLNRKLSLIWDVGFNLRALAKTGCPQLLRNR